MDDNIDRKRAADLERLTTADRIAALRATIAELERQRDLYGMDSANAALVSEVNGELVQTRAELSRLSNPELNERGEPMDAATIARGRKPTDAENAPATSSRKGGDVVPSTLNEYARECHRANIQWWRKPEDGSPIERNKGELLMLIVSEVAECMEGERKGLSDDKLPHRLMAEVELADILIRVFDYAGAHGYDIHGAYLEKMAFNASRVDHKHEARLRAGGKKW